MLKQREAKIITSKVSIPLKATKRDGSVYDFALYKLRMVIDNLLSLIHISEPTRPCGTSRMPSSA